MIVTNENVEVRRFTNNSEVNHVILKRNENLSRTDLQGGRKNVIAESESEFEDPLLRVPGEKTTKKLSLLE